jgi:hypothetical protein
MLKRRVAAWFRWCGLLALVCWGGAAQGQTLHWDATIGFGGAYKEGAWAPVFVDITNRADSRSGEILIPVVDYGRTGERPAITYTVPVESPRNSSKRYLLYVPPERVEKVYLKLGRLQYERELGNTRAAGRADSLVVVLGGERALLNFLQGAQAAPPSTIIAKEDAYGGPGGQTGTDGAVIQVGRAEWQSLPDSWLGWDGVDAVVLGDAGFASASPAAVDALLRWVELGGTLIVPGGALSSQMAASPLGRLLPITVRGTEAAPGLGDLAAWAQQPIEPGQVLLTSGPLAKGASALCGSVERPLIAVSDVGAGRIAMTAFDYTSAPVKYWDGQTAMWQRLIAQVPTRPSVTEAAESSSRYTPEIGLADAATYTPAAALPPFWLLLGFLGAYIIVLVPVNYTVLKRWDRRELAWVTTPAIVIVFTLGAYGLGYGMRGGQVVLNRLAVIEAASDTRLARARGYVGIFSPARTSYELLLKGTAASARSVSSEGQRTRDPAMVVYGPEPRVANIGMNMWTSRAFCVDFLADLKGGVSGVIEYDGKEVTLRVENNTGFTLKRCRLIQGSSQGKKKDVRPGAKMEWTAGGLAGVGDRSRHSGSQPTQMAIAEGMEDMAIRSLFGSRSYGPGRATAITSQEPCLVAAVDQPLVPVELARRRAQTNDLNILIARLPIRLAAARRINLPKWVVTGRPIAASGSIGGGQPWDPTLTIYQGSVIFEFRVPFGEKGGTARALTLRLGIGSAQGSAQQGTPPGMSLSAFNFRRGEWQSLPTAPWPVSFPSPAEYMTKDGRILVKIAAHADSIPLSDIGISGQVVTF